jgi:hypothetical protein
LHGDFDVVPFRRDTVAPTTAKLRHDIDRGRGGDKVDNIDPAAAPLGTDDEAAGTPAAPAEVKLAHRNEVGTAISSERKDPEDRGVAIWLTVVLVWSMALFAGIFFSDP